MATDFRTVPISVAKGRLSRRAFKSQRAMSTAEIAIEAIPGRPRLRIRDTIAFQLDAGAIASWPYITSESRSWMSVALPNSHTYIRAQTSLRHKTARLPTWSSSTPMCHPTQGNRSALCTRILRFDRSLRAITWRRSFQRHTTRRAVNTVLIHSNQRSNLTK